MNEASVQDYDEIDRLKKENRELKFNLELSNETLHLARETLKRFGWPDTPFLDDGIAAVASECQRLEAELKERLTYLNGLGYRRGENVEITSEIEWIEKTLQRPKKPNWLTGKPEDPKGEQK